MARHQEVLATIRDFAEGCGAARLTVVLDPGPVLIEYEPGELPVVNDEFAVPLAEFAAAAPLPVAIPKAIPRTAIEADPRTGGISAPIGGIHRLADGVAELARALGGRTAVVAEFATSNGAALTLAARPGEPVVLAIDDEQFEFPGSG